MSVAQGVDFGGLWGKPPPTAKPPIQRRRTAQTGAGLGDVAISIRLFNFLADTLSKYPYSLGPKYNIHHMFH